MCPDDCCAEPVSTSGSFTCPGTGQPGPAVGWRTVAAQLARPLPERQDFWVCRDPSCDIVYFGSRGAQIRVADLHVTPGFKRGGDLLCYCFEVRYSQLEAEIRDADASSTVERIAALVKAGGCACEVRNPVGKCCLRDVRDAFAELRRQAPDWRQG